MDDSKLTQMLLHFRNSNLLPEINSEADKRIFRELQRYNLLRVNSQGDWVVTRKGEVALKMGVKAYMKTEKFEEQLAREAPGLKTQRNLLLIVSVLLIGFLVFLLISSPDFIIKDLGKTISGS